MGKLIFKAKDINTTIDKYY